MTKMDTKHRISKRLLNSLPAQVAETLKAVAESYGIGTFTYEAVPEGYKFYAGEGYRLYAVYGDDVRHMEMVAEHNLGASGVSHRIGAEFSLPLGSWLIEVSYYTRFWMRLYHIGFQALEA